MDTRSTVPTEPLVRSRCASLLYPEAADAPHSGVPAPAHFADLNLDQLVRSLTQGREEFHLEDYYHHPLTDIETVTYRQEVLADLQDETLLEGVHSFADGMREVRLRQAASLRLHHRLQRQYWQLQAARTYSDTVRGLSDLLARSTVRSAALRGVADHLASYVRSSSFTDVSGTSEAVHSALLDIRYRLHLTGRGVSVGYELGEPDYAQDIVSTFERFRQERTTSHLMSLPEFAEMNHVEEAIAERVARLFPEVFSALAGFCTRHTEIVDDALGTLDRELQFYLSFLELVHRVSRTGLSWCLPEVTVENHGYHLLQTYDAALADRSLDNGTHLVCNDLDLNDDERLVVVTGPNNGGKTTFGRTIAQVSYLASLGLEVPGDSARLPLPDRILTHFERGENTQDRRGALADDLVRIHAMLDEATERSVLVLNEIFTSTSLDDAVALSTAVLRQVLDRGSLCLCVTFIDELVTLSETTVSLVAQSDPDSPTARTFRILRNPPSGLAYAEALARSYGLTHDALTRRLAR